MNFDLTEEEVMLKELAERFVADRYDPEQRRTYLAHDSGYSPDNWALLADMGLIGALYGEAEGGLAIGPVGLATVFEALGRGLVVEPLIETQVIAGGLFAATAPDGLKAVWMDALVSGEKRLAVAHREQVARRTMATVTTRAEAVADGYILNGSKSLVPAGNSVDGYIVSARVAGSPGDADGVALFLVDAQAPGLSAQAWRVVDGSVAVALTLENVRVEAAQRLSGGLAELLAAYERGALLQSAESLGIMERLHADTLDYLRTRKQFGVTLGSFQALQHRMVAQYAALEQARALLNLAMMQDASNPAARTRAIHGARAYIADAGVELGHEMIQLHGGMGVTDELIIGHGHKRLLLLSRWPEDATAALDRYAAV